MSQPVHRQPMLLAPAASVAISSQLMIGAVVFLFMVVVFIFFLYVYAKYYMGSNPALRRSRARLIFASADHIPVPRRGLDAEVLKSIPITIFTPSDFKDGMECAVCLSELSEGEEARILPKCNHGFHVECIDMWFHSHITCPLCRAPVTAAAEPLQVQPRGCVSANGYSPESLSIPANVLFWGSQDRISNGVPSQMADAPREGTSSSSCLKRPEGMLVIDIPSRAMEDIVSPLPANNIRAEEMKSPMEEKTPKSVFALTPGVGVYRETNRGKKESESKKMQSAAFAISPSAPLLKLRTPSRSRPNPNPNPSFCPIAALSSSSLRPKPISIHGAFSPLSPHSRPHSPLSLFSPPSDREVVVARSAAGESSGDVAGEKSAGSGMLQTLQLGALFGLWYLFNIYFNIYNKQVLKVFPYPMTMTTIQFAVGTVLVLFMWITNLHKKPKISSSQLAVILPLAMVHTLGNLFTNMSLGRVSVSFTHTIKAMEPFFSVLLSAMFLGEMPTPWVVLSLLPIVGGVALASMTEASFNWAGFWSAMASNVTFQSRNVLSKKVMVKKEESLDNINLFSIITIMSLFLLTPVTLFVEGTKFTPAFLQSAGLNLQQIYTRSLIAGLCFHAYQQVSYMILARVSPVTHSVGNCVKRVVVIVTSVLFFRTPVSPINSIGTGVALAGVFLYSRVKKIKPKTA